MPPTYHLLGEPASQPTVGLMSLSPKHRETVGVDPPYPP